MICRIRKWVAGLLTLGLVFAQIVTVAHACTSLAVPTSRAAEFGQLAGETMSTDCPEMAKRAAAHAKVCESHCVYGQQIDVHPDAPVAAIAPQPALTVRLLVPMPHLPQNTTSLRARSTAPPVSLLFSRFLI